MAGLPAKPGHFSPLDLDYVGCKAPQFSFTRLQGADPTLGVEMMSTGEVACFGGDMYEGFLLALMASGFRLPHTTRAILVSVSSTGKPALLDSCRRLQALGYTLYATDGTKRYLEDTGGMRGVVELHKPSSGKQPSVTTYLQERRLDLVINDPENGDKETATDGFAIRRTAIDYGVSLITNVKCAILLSLALERVKAFHIRSIQEYYAAGSGAGGAGAVGDHHHHHHHAGAGHLGRIGGGGAAGISVGGPLPVPAGPVGGSRTVGSGAY